MPPHKPTFQPPSALLTSSQHGHSDSGSMPVVQMRHSVVDPTKMGHFEEPSSDEPRQLESLTKLRPKQSGKRPPSTQFRSSNVVGFCWCGLLKSRSCRMLLLEAQPPQTLTAPYQFYSPVFCKRAVEVYESLE